MVKESPFSIASETVNQHAAFNHVSVASAAVLVTSPHGGDTYTSEFLSTSRLSPQQIRSSEDMFVTDLFANAPSTRASLLAARLPRAYVDLNRSVNEIDPLLFDGQLPSYACAPTPHVRAGLGVVPRLVADNMPIYDRPLSRSEIEARITHAYHPFHDRLRTTLASMKKQHGFAVLLDAHSMPSPMHNETTLNLLQEKPPQNPDIVLGTNFGKSCNPILIERICNWLIEHDYHVALDKPYAGGFITRHYGKPQDDIHALQIEIGRGLYMDEKHYQKHEGFTRIEHDMTELTRYIVALAPSLCTPASDARIDAAE